MKKLIYLMVVIAILGLIVSGCSIPLKSVVPTSEKGNPKPELSTPEIEMGVFVDYAVKAAHSRPPYDDTEDDYQIRAGIRWGPLPVAYYISENVTSSDITAIQNAFQTWENEPASNMDYTYVGSVLDTLAGPIRNATNTVSWQNLGSNGPVAVTYYWYYPSLKQIIEFDIVLNSALTWGSSGFDVQNVITHEAGHTLILFDLYAPKDGWLTMYGYTWLGDTEKQTLGIGDELGIQELYPTP